MYHALVRYPFKPEYLEKAIDLWKSAVKGKIERQPGFIRVQVYKNQDGEMFALGSWRGKEDAENFMKTGVFKVILETLEPYLAAAPLNKTYDLEWFAESGEANE